MARLHIHHTNGHEKHLRRLIRELDTPFDVTVHDYFLISRAFAHSCSIISTFSVSVSIRFINIVLFLSEDHIRT